MKQTGMLLLLITLLSTTTIAYAASDDYSSLFADATKIELNTTIDGQLKTEYDVDSFLFVAPESGYYSFLGSGEVEFRGHLYNSSYRFMYTGDVFSDKKDFFIVAYLQKQEQVFLKVDSTVRQEQNYKISVVKEILPFNKINPSRSLVNTYVYDGEVCTVKIPIRFYNNGSRLFYVSKAYAYLMSIKADGLIQGQAVFNTETYELEVDIYGDTDSVLTINLGADINCKIAIKAEYREKEAPIDSDIVYPPHNNKPDRPEPSQPDDKDNDVIPPVNYKKIQEGDCNLDNRVSMNDVAILLDFNAPSQFTEQQFDIADVTGNGSVDLTDALMILRRVTGAGR